MKTLKEIHRIQSEFEKTYKLDILGAPQGSLAWHQSKLGVISASNASKVVAKVGSDTRNTYMCELVAQVATGVFEEINSKYLDWGNLHEEQARTTYEFINEAEVSQVGLIFKDETFREGVSLDGIAHFSVGDRPLELKCPYNSVHYIKFALEGKIKSEYEWQCQFGMRALNAEFYDMAQFDPRVLSKMIHIVQVGRDEKMQATLNDAVPQFISDMDKMLKKLGLIFGQQWERIADLNKEMKIVS